MNEVEPALAERGVVVCLPAGAERCLRCGDTNWEEPMRVCLTCTYPDAPRSRAYLDGSALPTCLAPDCDRKASMTFHAAEDGRLAGRWWDRGDAISLCPDHACDIYLAQCQYVDELPEWLRADAKLRRVVRT